MPKQITAQAILLELSEDSVISDFLNFQKKSTRYTYTSYFRRLKEFTSETGTEILDNRLKWERKIFAFQRYLLERNYSENYAQSACGCVRGFFAFNRNSLHLTNQERKRLGERRRSTEDYFLDKEDIRKMSMHANLRDNYILLVGKSLGLRASDFVNLTYGMFRGLKLDNPAPVFIGKIGTKKERVPAFPFLDYDATRIVKAVLEANKDRSDDDFVLMTQSKKKRNTYARMQTDRLSIVLQRLAKRAKIEFGSKRIRFHCLRKYLCDRLSSVMSESKWKQIVGKKISEGAYISSDSLRKDFLRAMPTIAISTNETGIFKKELDETKQGVGILSKLLFEKDTEITDLKTMISGLTVELERIRQEQRAVTEHLFVRGPSMDYNRGRENEERTKLLVEQMHELTKRIQLLEPTKKKKKCIKVKKTSDSKKEEKTS